MNGKNISLLCFIVGMAFTLGGGVVSIVRGTIAADWTGIIGVGLALSQMAAPVNISKIIQNLKEGKNYGEK